ncbi:hypothetical protein BJ878DRAFT_208795 [Calycina marina]|uniref:Large ribosomal subunit protein uL23m n=1 Tax=Calycina marina TaxID=1763456 RepID=A0A9P7YYV3_9HELO|nr:hypothetical protein BJ878DRAFT_208795 [Calycina marina]
MSTAVTTVVSNVVRKGPKLGRKQIFLPNFTLTLLRTPALPPTFATFIVPLNLNKLDIRDYLWNVYDVRVNSVRSYIQLQKMRQDKAGAKRPAQRRWHRPRSIKRMTVEMERPFVWPEEPRDYEKWDKETHDAAEADRDQGEEGLRPDARRKASKERESMAEQAKQLLRQTEDAEWENVGGLVEVEQDVPYQI